MADFKPLPKANQPTVDTVGITIVRGRADFNKTRYNRPGRLDTLGSADAIEICTIPANCFVLAGYYKVVVGEGGTTTMDVGYSSGGTDNISNLDPDAAGNWTILTDPNFNADDWDFRTAATTVYAAPDHDLDKAVVDFMFLVVPANKVFTQPNT